MSTEREVLEPEVLPPEDHDPRPKPPTTLERFLKSFGPILAGVFLDLVDLATMGPAGFVIGAAVGFWLASIFKLPFKQAILLAVAAGWYCMLPFTRYLPLATLVGAYIRFRQGS